MLNSEKAVYIKQVKNDPGKNNETRESNEEEPVDKPESLDPSSSSEAKIYNRLKAVEFEIDAVASTFDGARSISSEDHQTTVVDDNSIPGDRKNDEGAVLASSSDLTLQHALAADRLKSLKRTKAQLEKELSIIHNEKNSNVIDYDKLLNDRVKEKQEPKNKRESKKAQKQGSNQSKRQRTASFSDDVDFDSVLDAASAGFVETVSKV